MNDSFFNIVPFEFSSALKRWELVAHLQNLRET